MAMKRSIDAIDQQFRERVKPIFLSWGLQRHPSSRTEFGRYQYGYNYEFADLSNPSNVKLCGFWVFSSDASLAINAAKNVVAGPEAQEIPSILSIERYFRLTRPFSIRRILTSFDVAFRLEQRKGDTVEIAVSRLVDDVIRELPRLKDYLYG